MKTSTLIILAIAAFSLAACTKDAVQTPATNLNSQSASSAATTGNTSNGSEATAISPSASPVGTSGSQSTTPLPVDPPRNTLNGTYAGQFILIKTASNGAYPLNCNVKFTLIDGLFNSTSSTDGISVGYGKYQKFTDSLNFDNSAVMATPGLLPGQVNNFGACFFDSYTIQQKGDSLILTKITNTNTYTYKLKKQ